MTLDSLSFRQMSFEDLDRVIEVEKKIYEFPWTRGNFVDSIESGYHCAVMERGGFLAGYGVMLLAAGEASLLNLSVAKNWQGMGMGRKFLEYFVEAARRTGANCFHLEVRLSNSAALNLYRSAGFGEICVRPNYYPAEKGREDALVMRREL